MKEDWNYIRLPQTKPQAKPKATSVIDTAPMVVGDRPFGHLLTHNTSHTPHGRGHITGYVKHFCSFYVDITGDNP